MMPKQSVHTQQSNKKLNEKQAAVLIDCIERIERRKRLVNLNWFIGAIGRELSEIQILNIACIFSNLCIVNY